MVRAEICTHGDCSRCGEVRDLIEGRVVDAWFRWLCLECAAELDDEDWDTQRASLCAGDDL